MFHRFASISKAGSIKVKFDFDIDGSYTVKLIDVNNNKVIQNNTFNSTLEINYVFKINYTFSPER